MHYSNHTVYSSDKLHVTGRGMGVYTQISSLFISSTQAVGKCLEPQHGSRHERCAFTHQDTSHRCGKCVTPTLILLAAANTAPDSTRPPTAHSAWSTSDYTKLASGTSTLYIKKYRFQEKQKFFVSA